MRIWILHAYSKHKQQFTIGTRFQWEFKWMWMWMQINWCKSENIKTNRIHSSDLISVFTPFPQIFSIKMDLLKQLQILEFQEHNAHGIGCFPPRTPHTPTQSYTIFLFDFSLPFHAQLAFSPQHYTYCIALKEYF